MSDQAISDYKKPTDTLSQMTSQINAQRRRPLHSQSSLFQSGAGAAALPSDFSSALTSLIISINVICDVLLSSGAARSVSAILEERQGCRANSVFRGGGSIGGLAAHDSLSLKIGQNHGTELQLRERLGKLPHL